MEAWSVVSIMIKEDRKVEAERGRCTVTQRF